MVVTGAMRNPTQPGADGPANLRAAVQVAASDMAREAGVVVVFNDQVHAARYVQKTHTSNVGAFTSPNCGPIGWLGEGAPVMPFHMARTETMDLPEVLRMPFVAIIKPGQGDDGALIDAALMAGASGIVLEATGDDRRRPYVRRRGGCRRTHGQGNPGRPDLTHPRRQRADRNLRLCRFGNGPVVPRSDPVGRSGNAQGPNSRRAVATLQRRPTGNRRPAF